MDGSGDLAYAGAADTDAVGTLDHDVFEIGDLCRVNLVNAQGTQVMIASEAVARGATCYAAANGKVAATGTVLVGQANEAAGTDGDAIEVIPSPSSVLGNIARSALVQDDLQEYPIPPTDWRIHDALQTNLPATAATDDLALITGTFGTDALTLQGLDFGGTTSLAYARTQFQLPPEYVDGQTVTLRVRGAMLTTVSDTTCTVDAEVHEADKDGAVGSDICATAAQSTNSLTPANKDFTITATGLVAGDWIDIRLAIAGNDSGDAGVMIPELSNIALLLDVKG